MKRKLIVLISILLVMFLLFACDTPNGGGNDTPTEKVATPRIVNSEGMEYEENYTFTKDDKLAFACDTEGVEIYFTNDGSDPKTSNTAKKTTTSGTAYTSYIIHDYSSDGKTVIKACAKKSGMTNSDTTEITFKIPERPLPPVNVKVEVGSVYNSIKVTWEKPNDPDNTYEKVTGYSVFTAIENPQSAKDFKLTPVNGVDNLEEEVLELDKVGNGNKIYVIWVYAVSELVESKASNKVVYSLSSTEG